MEPAQVRSRKAQAILRQPHQAAQALVRARPAAVASPGTRPTVAEPELLAKREKYSAFFRSTVFYVDRPETTPTVMIVLRELHRLSAKIQKRFSKDTCTCVITAGPDDTSRTSQEVSGSGLLPRQSPAPQTPFNNPGADLHQLPQGNGAGTFGPSPRASWGSMPGGRLNASGMFAQQIMPSQCDVVAVAKANNIRVVDILAIKSILTRYFNVAFPARPVSVNILKSGVATRSTAAHSTRAQIAKPPKGEFHAFQHRYMIFEELSEATRPTYKEYLPKNGDDADKSRHLYTYPFIDPNCAPGGCPFHHPHLTAGSKQRAQQWSRDSAPTSLLGHLTQSKPALKQSTSRQPEQLVDLITKKFCVVNESGTAAETVSQEDRLSALRDKTRFARKLLSADYAARKERESRKKQQSTTTKEPVQPDDRPGFCECCAARYSDVDRHMVSASHTEFASDAANYAKLDQLLAGLRRKPSCESGEEQPEIWPDNGTSIDFYCARDGWSLQYHQDNAAKNWWDSDPFTLDALLSQRAESNTHVTVHLKEHDLTGMLMYIHDEKRYRLCTRNIQDEDKLVDPEPHVEVISIDDSSSASEASPDDAQPLSGQGWEMPPADDIADNATHSADPAETNAELDGNDETTSDASRHHELPEVKVATHLSSNDSSLSTPPSSAATELDNDDEKNDENKCPVGTPVHPAPEHNAEVFVDAVPMTRGRHQQLAGSLFNGQQTRMQQSPDVTRTPTMPVAVNKSTRRRKSALENIQMPVFLNDNTEVTPILDGGASYARKRSRTTTCDSPLANRAPASRRNNKRRTSESGAGLHRGNLTLADDEDRTTPLTPLTRQSARTMGVRVNVRLEYAAAGVVTGKH